MAHYIPGLSAPVSNDNIEQVYCGVVLSTTDETFMSPLGGAQPNFPQDVGETIQLVSASAADVGTIRVTGLGVNFKHQEEDVELNGTTPVVTTKLFTRINDLTWLEVPALQGQVLAQQVGGAINYRSISVDAQISEDGVFTVPADRLWQVPQIYAAVIRDSNQQSTATINVYYRMVGFHFLRPFRFAVSMNGNSSASYDNSYPAEISGPADFYLTAQASDINTEAVSRLTIKMRTK